MIRRLFSSFKEGRKVIFIHGMYLGTLRAWGSDGVCWIVAYQSPLESHFQGSV
jgi:hypothetical protein